jgi:putrescine---pyruvate transaminase
MSSTTKAFLPYTNPSRIQKIDSLKVFKASHGCFLKDNLSESYLDLNAKNCGNVLLGYSDHDLINALTQQASILPYHSIHQWSLSEPLIDFMNFFNLANNQPNNGFFFANSGSEANESAIFLANSFWKIKGHKNKKICLSLQNGFSGSTIFLKEQLVQIHRKNDKLFGQELINELKSTISRIGADKISCLIIEPIQHHGAGATGDIEFFDRLKEILNENQILLILDEVVTGFGRCGSISYSQSLNFKYDIITFGKSSTSGYFPFSFAWIKDSIYLELLNFNSVFEFGYTNSGHPIGCALARIVAEKVSQPSFKVSTNEKGEILSKILTHGIPEVKSVKFYNLYGYLFFEDTVIAAEVKRRLFKRNILVTHYKNYITVSPPAIIDQNEFNYLMDNLR